MLLYPAWYRKRGIRRLVALTAPETHSLVNLNMPRGAVLSYLPEDSTSLGPGKDDPLIKAAERIVYVDHITELRSEIGNPKPVVWPVDRHLRDYQRTNRGKIRPMLNPETVMSNTKTLVVENFAPLQFVKRYTANFFASYYKWVNIRHTMWKKLNEVANQFPERHLFVNIVLPEVLPSFTALRRAEKSIVRNTLEKFTTNESLDILDIWTWLGEQRNEAPMANLETKNLDRLNLLFLYKDRWFCVNLGLLNAWRKTADESQGTEEGLDSAALQKRFLRGLMHLIESRAIVDLDEEPEVEEEDDIPDVSDDDDSDGPTRISDGRRRVEEPKDVKGKSTKPELIVVKDDPISAETSDINFEEETAEMLKEDYELLRQAELDDAKIEKELESLEIIEQVKEDTAQIQEAPVTLIKVTGEARDVEKGILDKANEMADAGLLSGSEYKRAQRLASTYKELPNPYGGKGTLADVMSLSPETLKITNPPKMPKNSEVFDERVLKSTLFEFDSRYVKDVLPKDIVNSVMSVQNAGVVVADYNVETVEDVMNHYEIHAIKLSPVTGVGSTIRFRVPKIHEDGTYFANGVRYHLRKQRGDMPIRKVLPNRVALTSYYGKSFVSRSEKAVHNYPGWLCNQIMAIGLDPKDPRVSNLKPTNVFNPLNKVPKLYSMLAHKFRSFSAGGIDFFLDYAKLEENFGEKAINRPEARGLVPIGKQGQDVVYIDPSNMMFVLKGRGPQPIPAIEEVLGLDISKAPVEVAELKVFNKELPMGLVLGYYLGLDKLIKALKPTAFRRVQVGDRLKLTDGEYVVRFADENLVFHRDDRLCALIMAGFNSYHKTIRNYNVYDFDRKDVYLNVLEANGIGIRYLRELDLLKDMFIDPITHDLLVEMQEPTDWIGLVTRATELLTTDWSPAETDMEYMRIKGYERIAGAVYTELVRSVRTHQARRGASSNKIEMPPNAIWQAIQEDPSKGMVEESNPIECLREQEAVTMGGTGGRSRRSMVKRSRIYHRNDMGVISEATVDSGDVAINTFLSADPNFKSLRGTSNRYDAKNDSAATLFSTAALISPGSDRDDPKRVNFVGIQYHSTMFSEGYEPAMVRTGYEQMVAHRVDDLFASTAKDDGTVTNVTDEAITIAYKNGSSKSIQLGRRFGTVAGTMFPHNVVTVLKAGDKFKAGDPIAYNTNYFQLDPINPKLLLMKTGILAKTVLLESTDTLEDSSVISEKLANKLGTKITKIRDIVVTFDQKLHSLVKVGQKLESDDILCTIEDAVTADNELFDENSLDTLRLLGSQTPRAKYEGIVERVEVFYNGDLEDMSESIRAVAVNADKGRAKVARGLNKTVLSGQVDSSLRIGGNPLNVDSMAVRVYITMQVGTGVGDKGVFANQLKTIFGRVMSGENRTESGEDLDAIFGYTSINARIVLSPDLIGTTTTLLKVIAKQAVKVYKGS